MLGVLLGVSSRYRDIASPPAPQPKHLYWPRSALRWKEGVLSWWKGQSALAVLPRTCVSSRPSDCATARMSAERAASTSAGDV